MRFITPYSPSYVFAPLLFSSCVDDLPFFAGSDVLPECELCRSCVRYHPIGTFIFSPVCSPGLLKLLYRHHQIRLVHGFVNYNDRRIHQQSYFFVETRLISNHEGTCSCFSAFTTRFQPHCRQVSKEEAQKYAEEEGLLWAEASAKSGEGVHELFALIGTSPLSEVDSSYL